MCCNSRQIAHLYFGLWSPLLGVFVLVRHHILVAGFCGAGAALLLSAALQRGQVEAPLGCRIDSVAPAAQQEGQACKERKSKRKCRLCDIQDEEKVASVAVQSERQAADNFSFGRKGACMKGGRAFVSIEGTAPTGARPAVSLSVPQRECNSSLYLLPWPASLELQV